MRWRKLIKDNQKNFSRLHMLIDVFVIAASYALAWLIRFQGIFEHSAVQSKTVQEYMFMLIFIIPGYLLLYQAFDLYTPMRMQGRRLVLAGIVKANALGLLIIMFALYNFKELDYSRLTLVSFCVINIVLEWFVRMVIFYILRDMRKKGMNQKQVLLVGYSRAAEEYVDRILQNPQWGYVIRGILDDNVPAGTTYKGVKVIGRIANLMIILPSSRLDEIAITLGLSEYYRLEEIVALCEKSGVHTKFIPDYNNIIPTKPYTEDILGLPVINIRYVPLSNTFNALIKRSMDIAGAIVAIIVSSPVMLVLCMPVSYTHLWGQAPMKKCATWWHSIFMSIRESCLLEMSQPSVMRHGGFPMPIIRSFPIWYLLYLWGSQVCSMHLQTDYSMRRGWQMCSL